MVLGGGWWCSTVTVCGTSHPKFGAPLFTSKEIFGAPHHTFDRRKNEANQDAGPVDSTIPAGRHNLQPVYPFGGLWHVKQWVCIPLRQIHISEKSKKLFLSLSGHGVTIIALAFVVLLCPNFLHELQYCRISLSTKSLT